MDTLLGTPNLTNAQVATILLLTVVLAFVMNAVALPLPPTWVVLAAIYGATHVPLLPLTFCGTVGAMFGRGLFALSIGYFDTKLPEKLRANAEVLARAVSRRAAWATPFVAAYTFLPLPSNPLFVAVGMGGLPLRRSMAGYFLGRWPNNTITLLVAQPVVGNVHDLFVGSLSWRSLAQAVAAVAAYLIFLSLPWQRWLGLETPETTEAATHAASGEESALGRLRP